MATISDEAWQQIQATHGEDVRRLDFKSSGTVVLRAPTAVEYKLFRQEIMNEATQAGAYEHLMLRTVVFPEAASFLALVQKRPGLTSNPALLRAVNELSGQADELEGKG